jgi:repressor of nif and glnA expression
MYPTGQGILNRENTQTNILEPIINYFNTNIKRLKVKAFIKHKATAFK